MINNSLMRKEYKTVREKHSRGEEEELTDLDTDSLIEKFSSKVLNNKDESNSNKESDNKEPPIWSSLLSDVIVICDLLEWFSGLY